MFIKLFYEVNKDEAILAGKSEWGTYCVEIDPVQIPEDLREIVAKYADDQQNLINRDIYGPSDEKYRMSLVEPIDVDQVFDILRDRISHFNGIEDRKYQRALDKCSDLKSLTLTEYYWIFGVETQKETWDGKFLGRDVPGEIIRRREVLVEEKALSQKQNVLRAAKEAEFLKKQAAADRAEREAQKNRENHRAELRDRLVRETIEKLGDRDDIERYTANLIGPDEKSQIISQALFADTTRNPMFGFGSGLFPLSSNSLERYQKIDSSELDHYDEDCEGTVEFTTGDPDHCTRGDWMVLKNIKSQHRSVRVGSLDISYESKFVEHVGTCNACNAKIRALSVCVTAIAEEISIATKHYAV